MQLSLPPRVATDEHVEKHVECILAKLRVPTRTAAALKAVQLGYTLLPIMPTLDESGKSGEEKAAEKLADWAIVRSHYKGRVRLLRDLTVRELSKKLSVLENEIIKRLMMKGFMRTVNQIVELPLAREVAIEMGFTIDPFPK